MGSKSLVPEPPPPLRIPSASTGVCARVRERWAGRARLSASLAPRRGASIHPLRLGRLTVPLPDSRLAGALHSLFRVISPPPFLYQLGMLKRD